MNRYYDRPHHDGSSLYTSTLGRGVGATQFVRVRVPHGFGAPRSMFVRVVCDAEPCFFPLLPGAASPDWDTAAEWWEGHFALPNPITKYRFLINLEDGSTRWLSADGLESLEPRDSSDFRTTSFPPPPSWAHQQVMYQIFPDRFARSSGASRDIPVWAEPAEWQDEPVAEGPSTSRQFFGGDLDGITERLDHLERLGVTLLYLTPFFPAQSNHRYDASSFDRVDPLLGGDEALVRLVEAAHARGMRVIGDLTTNHTGDGHEWFRAAFGKPSAVEADFYYWKDTDHTDYVGWYDLPSLPKLNWDSRELRRRFIEGDDCVVAKWLLPPFNLDGWRVDVANMSGRLGTDDFNRTIQRTVRATMDRVAPGRVLFAESTNDATVDFDGEGWHAPMSYPSFTRPVWNWLRRPTKNRRDFGIPYESAPAYSAADVVESYRRFTAPYPWSVKLLAMNAIDTHDTARFAEEADDERQLVAAGLSYTLPGTPVVFAGDEFGLRGRNGEGSRAPLPWEAHPRLLAAYSELGRLRRESVALQTGGLRWLSADSECLAFLRESDEGAELVMAFRSPSELALPLNVAEALEDAPTLTFGSIAFRREGARLLWEADGPAFGVWAVRSLVTARASAPERVNANA
ncbi:glycoside hydrolase family 13 protein [Agromyces sp. NPDC060279]|uniref:glycoside hydrolase family 13 protein n=1 Tax=Agromyces sp. NPDC060279 TaxID=3347092 RepID=UPI003662BFE2